MDLGGIIEIVLFIIKLPYHIYHVVTFGKYNTDETEKSIYNAVGILLTIFSILGVFIWLLLKLK